jgi:diguanylate cyclase (GGDEF)-like protein
MDSYREDVDETRTDARTGVFSRGLLQARLTEELERARELGEPCSVQMFDVDYFKSVNDAYGHARGDQVLHELAERVTGLVRTGDALFRYGGDEFVLLLPGTGKADALDVALRVVEGVRGAPFPGHPPLSLSISLGVATFPEDGSGVTGLLEAADRRSYLAKKRGRACAVADDAAPAETAPTSSRLLERDQALAGTQEFLSRLIPDRRGALRVTGPRGAGHSRFLAEVGKLAKLRGFDVFREPGEAWTRRVKGDTTDRTPATCDATPEGDPVGALLVVDGFHPESELDEVLGEVANARSEAGALGVVYGCPGITQETEPPGVELPVFESVELAAWSTAALRIWLRTTLRGEPSPELVDWLDGHTGGLPAEVERELNRLVEQASLERTPAGGWTLTSAAQAAGRRPRRSGQELDDLAQIAQRLCQLPPGVPDFTGRDPEKVELAEQIAAGRPRAAAVATVCGQPGVGKTTLAVHVAHELAARFPDGQWYFDLRGTDDHPLDAADALSRLLCALGVPVERIPAGLDERSALYRSLSYDRHLLLVLDNAHSEAQVRPLLPAGPASAAIVTSRRALAGLEGVHRLVLDMLSPEGSVHLLAEIVGQDRVAAEVPQAFEVARLCGYLPLALRIAGNRLASRTNWTFEHLVEQLRNDQRRLELLTAGDLQVRSTFAVSYQQLSPAARAAFRRLALPFGPDFQTVLAGVLVGDESRAEDLLDELVDASLIEPAPTPGRYRFHDLLRLFARDRLEGEEEPGAARESECRMLRWLIDTATWAAAFVDPAGEDTEAGSTPPPGAEAIAARAEALRWLDLEWDNWLGALRRCAELDLHADVLRLGRAMHWYSDVRWYRTEWREVFGRALDAARALGDRGQEGVMLNYLAWTYSFSGPYDEAMRLHAESLAICREVGNRNEEGWALVYLGNCHRRSGRSEPAAEHYRQALAVFREIEYQTGVVTALTHLGESLREAGQDEESLAYQEDAFAVSVRIGNSMGQAVASMRMGRALAALARWHEACGHFENAITCFRVAGNVWEEASVLHSLGLAHRALGNLEWAVTCLEQAVQIFTETRDRRQQALALQALSSVVKDLRGDVTATAYEQQAREILRQLG